MQGTIGKEGEVEKEKKGGYREEGGGHKYGPTTRLRNRCGTRALTIPVICENLTFDAYERIKEIY